MPNVGDAVDRYVIEAVIGEGGMGRVYRALDPRLGRRVALKVLLAEGSERVRSDAAARMVREARAAAAFNHPNVVAIYDVGEVDGSPYIAMELVSGRTLRTAGAQEAVTDAKKVSWLSDVARGLAAAHRSGLVHRDIKPDNVMITTDGVVKILDFGIARRADAESTDVDIHAPTAAANLPSITAEGSLIGTPQYMAPEQLRGEPLDGRCDQFAWGVMAWELLAGRSPWGSLTNPAVLLTAVLSAPAPALKGVLPGMPPAVSDVVERALSKDRALRFSSMDDVVTALEMGSGAATIPGDAAPLVLLPMMEIMKGETEAAVPAAAGALGSPTTLEPTSPRTSSMPILSSRRGRWLYVGLGVLVLGSVVAAGVRATGRRTVIDVAAPEASAPSPLVAVASASSPQRPPVVAAAGPEENLYPCKDTYRTRVPPRADEVCGDGLVAWCATDGTQAACCTEGMVARSREGTCQCPPGGVAADSPLTKCPQSAATMKTDGAARLPAETIRRVVRSNFGRLRLCYKDALKRTPGESGRLKVRFEIGPSGRVFFAHIQDTTLTDPAAQACMLDEFRAFEFPPPVGGFVTVVYPIILEPGD